jgi:hypothetical protein
MSLQNRFRKKPPKAVPAPTLSEPLVARLLSTQQTAIYLGRSPDLIREMVARGELTPLPKGYGSERQHVVFDRHDLDRLIETMKAAAAA